MGDPVREALVREFIETANNVDKSIDFNINYWLNKYEQYIREPNFPEAAMVIMSAAHIYIRKIDYFEEIVLHMNAEQVKNKHITDAASAENGSLVQQPPIKKRRVARRFIHKDTISDTLLFLETELKLPKCVPAVKITEKFIKNVQLRTNYQKLKDMFQKFNSATTKANKNKIKMPKILESSSNVSTIGKDFPIIDIEFDESIGLRHDYKAFSDIISLERSELSMDYNYNEYFKHVDLVDDHYEKEAMKLKALDLPLTNIPTAMSIKKKRKNFLFKLFMSSSYLKENYDIDIEANLSDDILLNKYITDFDTLRQAQAYELNLNDSNDQSNFNQINPVEDAKITELPPDTIDENNDNHHDDEDEVIATNCSSSNIPPSVRNSIDSIIPDKQKLYSNVRISIDEGLCLNIGDIDPEDWAKFNPTVDLTNIMLSLNDIDPKFSFNVSNLLEIDKQYLVFQEDFKLPVQFLVKEPELKLNIFKLPEKKLRKECIFKLPVEYTPLKKNLIQRHQNMSQSIETQARIFKFDNSFRMLSEMDTPPSSPKPDDEEDFRGFEDNNILSSTILYDKILQDTEDSITDGRRAQNRSMSRDSGYILSPMPVGSPADMETLMNDKTENSNEISESGYGTSIVSDGQTNSELSSTNNETDATNDSKVDQSHNISESGYGTSIASGTETANTTAANLSGCDDSGHFADDEQPSTSAGLSAHDEQLSKVIKEKMSHQIDEMQALVTKVNKWHAHLKPILKASEERNHFDIHEYGTSIIDSFPTTSSYNAGCSSSNADIPSNERPKTTLGNILKGREESTARYFLSMLQLANTNNIAINVLNKDPKKLSTVDEIEVELLSKTRHHELMEEDILPSRRKETVNNNSNTNNVNNVKRKKAPIASQKLKMSCSTPITAKKQKFNPSTSGCSSSSSSNNTINSSINNTNSTIVLNESNEEESELIFSQESGYLSGPSQEMPENG